MTGRGIDQILEHPCDPRIYEPWVRDARDYVHLAETVNGPIPRLAEPGYIWGEAADVLDQRAPAARIVNLETAITTHPEPWPGKGINYRMHPDNAACLPAAGISCGVLANNHVLDWKVEGLVETLGTLDRLGIAGCGAGENEASAQAPAVLAVPGGRLLVYGFGHHSSGIPPDWRAGPACAGVNMLPDLGEDAVARTGEDIAAVRRPGDIVIVSLHWGGNWGYEVPPEHVDFARGLVDQAGVDLVHGHSSHHPRPVEVHGGRLILYGCGDLLNDYEGIGGHAHYRPEIVAMYFPVLDSSTGELVALELVPMIIRCFRLKRADRDAARWLARTLTRESKEHGTRLKTEKDGRITVSWD